MITEKTFKTILLVPHILGQDFKLNVNSFPKHVPELPIFIDNVAEKHEIYGQRIIKVYKKYFDLAENIIIIHSDLDLSFLELIKFKNIIEAGNKDAYFGIIYNHKIEDRKDNICFDYPNPIFPRIGEVVLNAELDRFFAFKTDKVKIGKEMLLFNESVCVDIKGKNYGRK